MLTASREVIQNIPQIFDVPLIHVEYGLGQGDEFFAGKRWDIHIDLAELNGAFIKCELIAQQPTIRQCVANYELQEYFLINDWMAYFVSIPI